MPERGSKSQRCQSFEQVWNFFVAIHMMSCRDWWPAPTNSGAKISWKISHLDFFGTKTASSWLIIFQRAKLLTRSITHLCWCNWRTFWRKSRGKITKAVLFLHENAPAHRALATKETCLPGLPMSWAPTLFSGSGPIGLPPVSRIEKKMKVAIFRPTRSLLPRRPGWTDNFLIFFLNGWQKIEQRAKKCIELPGEYVE